MGILDIQRNHMTIFNLRLGKKVVTKNGKEAPEKLVDQIRVTSPNQYVVDAFCRVYGGHTQPWGDQFEAFLPTTEIPIMVLPGQSVTQWWEKYRGGVCERRCEGLGGVERISGTLCKCDPDIDKRLADKDQCNLMTRIHFLCPEVEVAGAGALVTHGRVAAETLPQSVAVAEAALKAGHMVPAILRIVKKTGKNRQYVVPQIEMVGMTLGQIIKGQVDQLSSIDAVSSMAHPEASEIESPRVIESKVIEVGEVSDRPALGAVKKPTHSEIYNAYALLDEETQTRFRQWWKSNGLPVGDGIAQTLDSCPNEHQDKVLYAISVFAKGSAPGLLSGIQIDDNGSSPAGVPTSTEVQATVTLGAGDFDKTLKEHFRRLEIAMPERPDFMSQVIGRSVKKQSELTAEEKTLLIRYLESQE